jgi:hypothetical protein
MQSKHPDSNTKTKEKKIEAMRKLKQAYDAAKASGNVKKYQVSL